MAPTGGQGYAGSMPNELGKLTDEDLIEIVKDTALSDDWREAAGDEVVRRIRRWQAGLSPAKPQPESM